MPKMDTNYPIVKLVDHSGNVLYARTYNWSSTGVATGNAPVHTTFQPPAGFNPNASYSLYVIANGISSAPINFTAHPGILLLDRTGSGSLSISGNGNVTDNDGPTIVDSNASSAMSVTGNGAANAGEFDISGGYSTGGHGSITGTIYTNQPPAFDLLQLPLPSQPPAPSGNTSTTLNPGTYVGGIHLSGSGVVTLNPGIYYMQGGGFSVSGHISVTGNGVLIVNAPNTSSDVISITTQGSVNLTAPTTLTGPYAQYNGIQILQTSSNPITFASHGATTMTGVMYDPNAPVGINGSATVTISGELIAYDLQVAGSGGSLIINPDSPAATPSSAAASSGALPAPNTVAPAKLAAPAVVAAPDVRAAALSALISQGGLSGPSALTDQDILNELAASLSSLNVSGDSSLSGRAAGTRSRGGTLAFKGVL